jgi:hypothetical protein
MQDGHIRLGKACNMHMRPANGLLCLLSRLPKCFAIQLKRNLLQLYRLCGRESKLVADSPTCGPGHDPTGATAHNWTVLRTRQKNTPWKRLAGWAGLVWFQVTKQLVAWKKDRKWPSYADGLGWLILVGQNREREEEKKENFFLFQSHQKYSKLIS